ncbi:histidine kinase dimerization/phosphoacceptor domain -containing protein [Balneolaceae bacterium ANBcel3]|nr:histidine kinase dimerization/phosphoacceptor domain -containing protein [Balneolaceae bacterium ANBcel3]
MIVPEVFYNLTLLVALCVLSGFLEEYINSQFLPGKIVQGLLFGAIALISMSFPYEFIEGIIFDGRTVVVSMGTLFFGPLTGIISVIMAIILRLSMGGDGMIPGILILFAAFFSAWGYRLFLFRNTKDSADLLSLLNKKDFYVLGLLVHLLMVFIIFLLPNEIIWEVLNELAFSILVIFPLVTLLIGKLLQDQQKQRKHLKIISESEHKFRSLVESTDDIIFTMDTNFRHTGVYGGWVKKANKTPDDFIGKTSAEILEPEVAEMHQMQYKKTLAGETAVYEWETPVDGVNNTYQTKLSPIKNDEGYIIGLVGVGRNITPLKHYQKELAESLREKQVLLSEIHHRVKNNMAIISSLLAIRSDYFTDDENKKIFLDTESKVRSMALLHEMVYEQNNFAQISMPELLQRLIRLISESYDFERKKITMELDAEPIKLDMNTSIPFVLLVSELITNAYKHGFNNQVQGVIRVSLTYSEGVRKLTVSDDGLGVPDTKALGDPTSFGYTIIHGLVRQLRGTISFDNSRKGLSVIVTF